MPPAGLKSIPRWAPVDSDCLKTCTVQPSHAHGSGSRYAVQVQCPASNFQKKGCLSRPIYFDVDKRFKII